jgi:hypothetical protein
MWCWDLYINTHWPPYGIWVHMGACVMINFKLVEFTARAVEEKRLEFFIHTLLCILLGLNVLMNYNMRLWRYMYLINTPTRCSLAS